MMVSSWMIVSRLPAAEQNTLFKYLLEIRIALFIYLAPRV